MAQAGLPADLDRDRIGCVVGTGLPGAELWHRGLHASYAAGRPDDVARMTAIAITGNAVTGQLALRYGLRGPSLGLANACASGTTAIAIAMDQLRLGRADAMVVGGCESSMRSLLTYACFVGAGMNATTEPIGACAPFAAGRRGFVLAEGAGILILERLEVARARGARILGLVTGASITNDAHHVISPEPSGEAWARTMALALADAGVTPDAIDAISAHATGTPQGDVAETRAIKRVFGARAGRIPVSATKSMHGHAFGAAGAIEVALTVAAIDAGIVLPTINLHARDPECDLDYVAHEARPHPVRHALKNGFGAGGAATSIVLTHPQLGGSS
jgi:3-oxoacyl-[acyl-carrier-protein] synthase II